MTWNDLSTIALLLQLAATFYMVGLVWFVQRVHYPLFSAVGDRGFSAYEQAHVARTGPVVGPPMLIEAATALFCVVAPAPHVAPIAGVVGLGLLAIVWLSTAALQVPRHRELSEGFDASAHRSLVVTNWLRTVAWSLRGLLLLWMVASAMGPA